MLGYILRERRESSLFFYMVYMDGLRQVLFPEIGMAVSDFSNNGDWSLVEEAVATGRRQNLNRAALMKKICLDLAPDSKERIAETLEEKLLKPLGLTRQ
jgi:hypothetical protein